MSTVWSRYRVLIVLVTAVVVGQGVSFVAAPTAWQSYLDALGRIVSMIAFWGPIVALIASGFVWVVLRLLGFHSLEVIRHESVEQNNPAPAILFVGALIASVLFLMLVIKP